jgi:hypothetical protein
MTDSRSLQLPMDLKKQIKPTGDIWNPSPKYPASVPVPLPVIMVRVDGPFTALDRKLWLLMLHNAWDDLENEKYLHTISISEILRLFRQFGRHDIGSSGKLKTTEDHTEAVALWASLERLVDTKVRWEDAEYQGVGGLFASVLMSKQHRQSGWVHYSFGELLAKNLLLPRIFARLRPHFMMRLRSKYAITLYEILEAYVNRHDPTCTVSIDELRLWLKVPKGAYPDWKNLKRNVVLPAVDEINQHGEDSGFFVGYEGLREGKAFTKIKFTLSKSAVRDDRDTMLQGKAKRAKSYSAAPVIEGARYEPTDAVLEQLRTIAPGWDRQGLVARYHEWSKGKAAPSNPHGAFVGWAKRFTKGKAAA